MIMVYIFHKGTITVQNKVALGAALNIKNNKQF